MVFRIEVSGSSAWAFSVVASTSEDGIYSVVDKADAQMGRYYVGVCYSRDRRDGFRFLPGIGLARNTLDIEGVDTAGDVEGLGAYVEVRLAVAMKRHIQLGAGGRVAYWQGEDGVGNTGEELSTSAFVELSFQF